MKKPVALLLSIWAFGLILITQPVEAEMTELTEDQMEAPMFKYNNFSLGVVLGPGRDVIEESKTETDELFVHEEEKRLGTHLRENFSLESEWAEHTSHRWEHVNPNDVIFGFGDAELDVQSRGYDISSPSGETQVRER